MRIFQDLATAVIGALTVALAAPVAASAVPSGPPAARSVAVEVPAGWHVVETPRATHTLEVTVALVAPRGTTPRFGVAEARRSIEAAGAFLSSETDGAVIVEVERVIDWTYREDDTPCSWSGAHHDLVIQRTGWQGGPGRHLVVMVPEGDPCPGWANGEQGWGIAAGGRTFQPGTDVDTLVHELGHNMSLPHNVSIGCAEAWDFSTVGPGVPAGCRREEYGNVLDVMGGSWWALHPLSSPNLARLGQLPQRWEPACGGVRRLTVRPTGAGAADRTAVSFVDPRDPGARYWVDFRSQADGRKYDHLVSSPWSFRPARAGLQVQRTDPELGWATAVLERPGDRDGHRQLTDVGERVPLAGGAWVQLDAVAADGRSGDISISVPCTGSEPQPDPQPEPQPAVQLPAAWVLSPGTRSGRPYAATTVGVSAPTITGAGTSAGVTADYQWLLDGAPVAGATRRTWVPPVTAVGHDLTLRLRLTAPGYLPREGTFGFGRVAQRAVPAGWVAAPPVVSGTPRVGRTVSVTGPSLTATARGAGATVFYQWFLDGRKIPGATSRTYRVPAAARGGHLTLGIAVTKTAWTPLHQTVAVGRVR